MKQINYSVLHSLNFTEDQIEYFKKSSDIDELETQKKWLCIIADLTNILYECDNNKIAS